MSKKLVLIYPVGEGLQKVTAFEPIGLGIIAALTPDEWDIEIIDENLVSFEFKVADLVGISITTASAVRGYQIASCFIKQNIPVILGGAHATLLPNEAKQFSTSIVIGYAEPVWERIIKDFISGDLQPYYNNPPNRKFNFVKPKRELYEKKYLIATIQASRGCLYNCTFCNVPTINYNDFYSKSNIEIIEELQEIKQDYFIFCDDNFYGFTSDYHSKLIKLFSSINYNNIKKYWMCCASISVADDTKFLEAASNCGCRLIYIGIENNIEKNLKEINKIVNINRINKKDNSYFIQQLHKYKIGVFGGFVCGYENDDINSLMNYQNYILKEKVDAYTFTVLTPLPRTILFNELESKGKIIFSDFPNSWNRFNMSELVYHLPKIDNLTFKNIYNTICNKLFSTRSFIIKFIKSIINTNLQTSLIVLVFILNYHVSMKKSYILNFIYSISLTLFRRR